jgi:hypothetical protein
LKGDAAATAVTTLFFHRAHEARAACREQHVYLLKNGIFMRRDMKQQFDRISDLVWKALVEHQINKSDDVIPRLRAARDALEKEGDPLMQSLEEAIHGALWEGNIMSSLKTAA